MINFAPEFFLIFIFGEQNSRKNNKFLGVDSWVYVENLKMVYVNLCF